MDWLFKALLAAGTVWLVMWIARRCGRRLAGVVAGLPTVTVPTLAWLAHEEGVPFAVNAAVAGVAACAMLAVFALGYARAAQGGRSAVAALGCGLVAGLAMLYPAESLGAHLPDALVLALVACAISFAAMPASQTEAVSARRSPRPMLLVAIAAGSLTAFTVMIGPSLGAFASGLLSSLPVISASVAMCEHRTCGDRAATNFLRGYVGGLLGKAAFGVLFALLAPRIGVAAALLLASVAACALSAPRTLASLPVSTSLAARASQRPE